jgi:guanylate kinase
MSIKPGNLFIITAPSGAGKSSLIKSITEEGKIELSVSATTREPRINEVHERDYSFLSINEFQKLIDQNSFLEYAKVHEHFYGTLLSHVSKKLDTGIDIILDIDVQGFYQLQEKNIEYTSIFILPPSLDILRERLKDRATESTSSIDIRLLNAKKEIKAAPHFDYLVLNDNFEDALSKLRGIFEANNQIDQQIEQNTLNELLNS